MKCILILSLLSILVFATCEEPTPDIPPILNPQDIPITDPLFSKQWYLYNDGTDGREKGIDINVLPVWKKGHKGEGINVGILDNLFNPTHPDLKDNFPLENYKKIGTQYDKCSSHGNTVAGIIGARDNTIGIRGIAYRSKLYGYSSFSFGFDKNILDVFSQPESTSIAVYNLSMGNYYEIMYEPFSNSAYEILDSILEKGFHTKGALLVIAGGNQNYGGNSSNTNFSNHHGAITVNAIRKDNTWRPYLINQSGHTVGTNIWITAPSDALSTGALCDEEYTEISFTSSAAPMVSGVIALLREAYPDLTWRDVKLILVESAKKILPDKEDYFSEGYLKSGTMYHNPLKEQKYHRLSGFGLVDAGAAFELAENWRLLPKMEEEILEPGKEDDKSKNVFTNKEWHVLSMEAENKTITFIESLTLEIEIEKNLKSEYKTFQGILMLTSPDGKKAYFYHNDRNLFDNPSQSIFYHPEIALLDAHSLTKNKSEITLLLLTNRFLGTSMINGRWKLSLKNHYRDPLNIAILNILSWKITIRGH